jgi:dimeric dUTPase (all-alpha-NTP-PPase superfamily)
MMQWKLEELLITQKKVNDVVMKKLENPPTKEQYALALHVEVFELFNEIGTWKWWKHSHLPKKDRILDELADVIAFFLSYFSVLKKEEQLRVALWMDETFETYMETDYSLIEYVSENVTEGVAMPPFLLMTAAIAAVLKVLNCQWQEIINAYNEKSKVNIERQENNY